MKYVTNPSAASICATVPLKLTLPVKLLDTVAPPESKTAISSSGVDDDTLSVVVSRSPRLADTDRLLSAIGILVAAIGPADRLRWQDRLKPGAGKLEHGAVVANPVAERRAVEIAGGVGDQSARWGCPQPCGGVEADERGRRAVVAGEIVGGLCRRSRILCLRR